MEHKHRDPEQVQKRIHQVLRDRFHVEDSTSLELLTTLHRVAIMSDTLDSQGDGAEPELSGPRWWLMLRLFFEEEIGNDEGITPSHLSHSQRVSRNTISSLLRGLESQDMIVRVTDPADLRIFRIRLSEKGRQLILRTVPVRIQSLDHLYAALTQQEKTDLLNILHKIERAFRQAACPQSQPAIEPTDLTQERL
jgi:DNA-binding MarR family transcriptional regulator